MVYGLWFMINRIPRYYHFIEMELELGLLEHVVYLLYGRKENKKNQDFQPLRKSSMPIFFFPSG